MTEPAIAGVAPFFIVADVPRALSFYRDMLGFDITFRGPSPEDEFFGIVRRGAAMVMFKALDVEPFPNYICRTAMMGLRGFVVEDMDGYGLYFGCVRA